MHGMHKTRLTRQTMPEWHRVTVRLLADTLAQGYHTDSRRLESFLKQQPIRHPMRGRIPARLLQHRESNHG